MNKKIIAAFCIVILMVSVFSACGNKDKGYLLAKDQNGYERAFVTNENGETVTNANGEVRVYLTEENGEIVRDAVGVPMEDPIEMPEAIITDTMYKTKEFIFNVPSGWKVGNGTPDIAISEDGLTKIQFNNTGKDVSEFNSVVAESVEQARQIVERIKDSNGTAELKEGKVKLTSNQIDAYYLVFDAEFEVDGEKHVLHTCAAYLMFEERVYKAFYQTEKEDSLTNEQIVELFNNLTLNHVKVEKTTAEAK